MLLADEPTSDLDAANRERTVAALRAEAARGAIVVMATHDPEAAAQADGELHLDAGTAAWRRRSGALTRTGHREPHRRAMDTCPVRVSWPTGRPVPDRRPSVCRWGVRTGGVAVMHARNNRPGRARRAVVGAAGAGLGVTSALVGLTAPPTAAAADDPTSAPALAAAIAADRSVVTGAGFETRPPAGGTALASAQGVSGFPHDGADFAILSTGEASGLYPGSGSQDEDRGGSPVRAPRRTT